MTAFDKIYRIAAVDTNYVKPTYPRLDNWAIDRYEMDADHGVFFAGLSDAGYSKYVGYRMRDHVCWRVDEIYGHPLKFSGITAEQFEALAEQLNTELLNYHRRQEERRKMSLIEQLRVLSHNEALTQSERETIYAAIRALG